MNMNKQSIIDKAKKIMVRGSPNYQCTEEERIDLVLAFLTGKLRMGQIVAVVWPGKRQASMSTSFYSFVAHGIKDAYQAGKIKIV